VARFVPQGAIVLSGLTFGYFVMGQIRNRVLATTFTDTELDAYNVAFRIPEIALDILVAAGLTAPFVPIFSKLRQGDEREANDFARTVFTAAILVMAIAMAVLVILAPLIAERVGADFDPATRLIYIDLFRINCLAQILFAASIAVGEVLIANRRFVFYALAPILYTGGIVIGAIVAGESLGIYAPAWGAVGGAAAHLAIRTVGTFQTTFRIGPRLAIRTAAFREFIRLMLPRMVSYPIEPILFTYFAVLALSFGPGSVTALNFASDYQVVPVSLIGVQFSLAVFPALSAATAAGDRAAFWAVLRRNVITIGGLTLAAAIGLAITAPILIDVLLGGGEFGPDDVARTSLVLQAFALSVPFDALAYPLSRALYATHNTILQVIASFAGFGTILVAATSLSPTFELVSIPLAYAAGSVVKVALLAIFLAGRMRRIDAVSQRR
jgi:putative peptidoglycan lipid II flippase